MNAIDISFQDEAPPDDPPDTGPEKTERPTTGTCSECGTTFDISPRGRVPTKCPEHRKNGGSGGSTRTPRKSSGSGFLSKLRGKKTRRRKASKKSVAEYTASAHSFMAGMVIQPLTIMGLGMTNPAPLATAFTFAYQCSQRHELTEDGGIRPTGSEYGPLPEALGEIAALHPGFADILDSFDTAVPYMKLAAAVMPIVPQVFVNVGMVKPGALGTADPEVLADIMRNQAVQAMEAQFIPFGAQYQTEPNGNGQHP